MVITTPLHAEGVALSSADAITLNIFNLGNLVAVECTWMTDKLQPGVLLGTGGNGYALRIADEVYAHRKQRDKVLRLSPPSRGASSLLLLHVRNTTTGGEVYRRVHEDISEILEKFVCR